MAFTSVYTITVKCTLNPMNLRLRLSFEELILGYVNKLAAHRAITVYL